MKLVCRPPLDKLDRGSIWIYDLTGLEYQAMYEEICMTKEWVDRLYREEHKDDKKDKRN